MTTGYITRVNTQLLLTLAAGPREKGSRGLDVLARYSARGCVELELTPRGSERVGGRRVTSGSQRPRAVSVTHSRGKLQTRRNSLLYIPISLDLLKTFGFSCLGLLGSLGPSQRLRFVYIAFCCFRVRIQRLQQN